jgi:hypothetical protein
VENCVTFARFAAFLADFGAARGIDKPIPRARSISLIKLKNRNDGII